MQARGAVILVVEDEIIIRMDIVDQLSACGHILLEASSGLQALQAITDAEQIDIVFTDVEMPGDLDGIMLAHKVSQGWPDIGLIITSGKTSLDTGSMPGGSRFLPKPYTTEAIYGAIQEMLVRIE